MLQDPKIDRPKLSVEDVLSMDEILFADLSGIDLSGKDLSNKIFKNVIFDGANLDNADFTNSEIFHSSINNASCKSTIFNKSRLVQIKGHKTNLTSANFTEALLEGVKVRKGNIKSTSFLKAKFKDSSFLDCCNFDLGKDIFDDVHGCVIFDGVEAVDSTFSGNWSFSSFKRVKFIRCKLEQDFFSCDFSGSIFQDVVCNESKFEDSTFDNTSIRNSEFKESLLDKVSFKNSNIKKCSFLGAYLVGAVFTGSRFVECDFKGSTYSSSQTIFPEGFYPEDEIIDYQMLDKDKFIHDDDYNRARATILDIPEPDPFDFEREYLFQTLSEVETIEEALKILGINWTLPKGIEIEFIKLLTEIPTSSSIRVILSHADATPKEIKLICEAIELFPDLDNEELKLIMDKILKVIGANISLSAVISTDIYGEVLISEDEEEKKEQISRFTSHLKRKLLSDIKDSKKIKMALLLEGVFHDSYEEIINEAFSNYKMIAHSCHPDHTDDPKLINRFKLANSAAQLLSRFGLEPARKKSEKKMRISPDPFANIRPLALPERIEVRE